MSTLDVSEYIDTSHGNLVAPPCAHQVVPIGAEPTESQPLNKLTRAVRLVCDQDCRISISADPAAPMFPLTAGRPEQRIVIPGEGFKVRVIAAGSVQATGAPYNTAALLDLISVVADSKKSKAVIEQLSRAQSEAAAAVALLGDVRRVAAELAKQQSEFQAGVIAQREQHQAATDRLNSEREVLEAGKRAHVAAVEALARERAELDKSRTEHALQLAELARLRNLLNANAA
jgi:hypothetical protein